MQNERPDPFYNILANGVVGGIASRAGGGNFGHGFASAGASAFAKHAFDINAIGDGAESHRPHRIAAAAAVGGTVSAATGGKFANGAVTAAFVQAYNGEQENRRNRGECQKTGGCLRRKVDSLDDAVEFGIEAARRIARVMESTTEEHGKWSFYRSQSLGGAIMEEGGWFSSPGFSYPQGIGAGTESVRYGFNPAYGRLTMPASPGGGVMPGQSRVRALIVYSPNTIFSADRYASAQWVNVPIYVLQSSSGPVRRVVTSQSFHVNCTYVAGGGQC